MRPTKLVLVANPLPGLFSQIAERYGVDFTGVPCIGNSLSDMQVAEEVGCLQHMVLSGRHPEWLGQGLPPGFPDNTQVHADLAACVDHLLGADPGSRLPLTTMPT